MMERMGIPNELGGEWAGWCIIVFLCLIAAGGVLGLLDRDEQIIISYDGIYYKPWSTDIIPWEEIRDVNLYQTRYGYSIHLSIFDHYGFPPKNLFGKFDSLMNKLLPTKPDISIGLGGTDGRVEDAMEAICAYRDEIMSDYFQINEAAAE
jgi:ABC-type microcin C transport system permease subunit YejE